VEAAPNLTIKMKYLSRRMPAGRLHVLHYGIGEGARGGTNQSEKKGKFKPAGGYHL